MTKYNTIDELDARIEKIISKTIKHYYSDWKNYDRPRYMSLKGSHRREDKQIIIIVRECGCYLYTLEDIASREWCTTVYEYYQNQEHATYYRIDLDKLSIQKIDPGSYQIATYKAA